MGELPGPGHARWRVATMARKYTVALNAVMQKLVGQSV